MISRKFVNTIEFLGFILFAVSHLIYATFHFDVDTINRIFGYLVISLGLVILCLFIVKKVMWSQLGFSICVILVTNLVGWEMKTLVFEICIYMLTGAVISLIGDIRLNVWYSLLVNYALGFRLWMEYNVLVEKMDVGYYIMLILFCEFFLLTENVLVMFYRQKVDEVEKQNTLLNIAQKSKDEFLANMSHEIRTPMNAIVGMSELIMRETDINDQLREYCYNIQTSGENLLGIINDILDFSKIESGKLEIVYEPYSIASVIQDVANTAMFRRGYKDIDIIIDCSPNMPKQLYGDVLRNRQILMNIVSNAVKFTEKGQVFIQLSCYEIAGENWLKMKVEDTGIGIKKDDQENLFESFSRFDTKRNRSVEGTGLGLAICKRLVQEMNGNIQLKSEYNVGTTIVVDIPQKIVDESPFLRLKESEGMKVVLYGDKEQYRSNGDKYYCQVNEHIWHALRVPYRTIVDFLALTKAVAREEMTHLFIGAGEYTDQRNYFDQIAKQVKVFVVYDPQCSLKLGEHVYGIHKPFCSIDLVSIMNGEAFYNAYIKENEICTTFKAPEAKVLVVDDNEINLRVTEGIMKLYEAECILAKSGQEAIKVLKSQDIDLVFMDHMMPDMDGIETTNIIRRTGGEYGRKLPVIALTANVVNDARSIFLNQGFQDFLAKPVRIKELDTVFRRWLPGIKIHLLNEADRKQVQILGEDEFGEEDILYEEAIGLKHTIEEPKEVEQSEDSIEQKTEIIFMTINEEAALVNMGGQRDLFKELLEYSLELEEQRKKEMIESFEKQNWEEYMIQVHALKGGMRSLGIEEIASLAQKQEFACKENRIEDAIAGHEYLLAEYDRAHRSIEHYLEENHIE